MIDGKAEDRAAKIVLMIRGENTSALAHSQIQEVAAEIRAAVEEAIQEFVRVSLEDDPRLQHFKLQLQKEGALKAYEDAAKITSDVASRIRSFAVKEYPSEPEYIDAEGREAIATAEAIAEAIRARAAEVGK